MTETTRIAAPLLALALGGLALPAQAQQLTQQLNLAQLFSDHAVLQREQPIAIWGTAGAGRKLSVTLGGATVNGSADAHGKWRVELPPQPAGGPYRLTVSSDGQTVSRDDLLVGDVYLCSGQSNMEFAQRASTNAMGATYGARNDKLRYLNIQKNSAATPQDELKGPVAWTPLTPETVGDASAVCYYMARSLQAS
jgi:sialate O-acetylesterase